MAQELDHAQARYLYRQHAEELIERAIELLDELDGDTDLEGYLAGSTDEREGNADDAEPTLGAREGVNQTRTWKPTTFAHCLDGETEEDDPPEPSLGSPNPHAGNLHTRIWWGGAFKSLWRDGLDQRTWASGTTQDLELGDDNGLGDPDGLYEQVDGREPDQRDLPA
jgi:hypothetical protein